MSKLVKNALNKLGHHDKDKHHDGNASNSGSATPNDPHHAALAHVNSELNSPTASGATTPVNHEGSGTGTGHGHASGKSHGHGHGPLDALFGKHNKHDKHEKHGDGLERSDSTKCKDPHEHFLAVKANLGNKKNHDKTGSSSSPRASMDEKAATARPGMHHTLTEDDSRALKVDRAAELKQEQLQRELGYKEAYEKDPLNKHYGFLNIDATPNVGVDTSGKYAFPTFSISVWFETELTRLRSVLTGKTPLSRSQRRVKETKCISEQGYRAYAIKVRPSHNFIALSDSTDDKHARIVPQAQN
jgi:hypothetical protein